MMNTYFPILLTILFAAGFVASMLVLSVLIGPKKVTKIKMDPFECGTVGTGRANERFSVKFYLVAILFIIFDIEIAFMYPWAINLVDLSWFGFWVMQSFVLVLAVGLAYAWRKGALDWA